MKTRILLVDDHQMMRDGLRMLLEGQSDLQVIGEADNGRLAVELAARLRPELVVMDVGLPDLNGIEATRQVRAAVPHIKVLALSMHSDKRYVLQMLEAGAAAYLLKNSAFDEMVRAIRAVIAGEAYLSPEIASVLTRHVVGTGSVHAPATKAGEDLSGREREVLQLLAEGNTSKEIATKLHITARTIESHRREIMRKLDLHSVAALTKYAVRNGITSLEA